MFHSTEAAVALTSLAGSGSGSRTTRDGSIAVTSGSLAISAASFASPVTLTVLTIQNGVKSARAALRSLRRFVCEAAAVFVFAR